MKRFHFFLGLMTAVLLLSACQSSQSNVMNDPSPPPQTFCEGNRAWSAEVRTDDVMNYTTFWIAFESASIQDEFQYIHVDVTLDGASVAEEMKYVQAVEHSSVTCTDSGRQFEANQMQYTLILPPLSAGEHIILWRYTMPADQMEGMLNDSRGMTAEYRIKLNIAR